MSDFDDVAVPGQATRNLFGNHDRAMLTAGAPKSHGQIALPFVDVVRQQKKQHIRNPVEELARLRKADDVVLDLWIFAGKVAEFRNKVRVGKKAHIENQIGLKRHALLVAEADRGNEQTLAVVLAHKLVLDISAEFVDIELCRIDDDVGDVADGLQQTPLFLQSFRYAFFAAEGVRPARFGVARKQRSLRGFQKQHGGR